MFIVCGEALFDVFIAAETIAGLGLDARIGGSPYNTAVGLARLGQPVALLAALARDPLGDRLVRSLVQEGVETSLLQRNDARTTLSLVGLDASGVPTYAFYGDSAADSLLTASALDAVPATACAIHVGSYATVVEPTAATLRALVEREHGRTPVVYDPNVRLAVQPDLTRWRGVLDWMMARTQLLKISDEDLHLLRPGCTGDAFAAEAIGRGVAMVVMTRGERGAVGWTGRARTEVPGLSVKVVDTVGAGDSFEAALLAWLAENGALLPAAMRGLAPDDLGRALGFASRAAAITCSRRGADLPRRGDVADS